MKFLYGFCERVGGTGGQCGEQDNRIVARNGFMKCYSCCCAWEGWEQWAPTKTGQSTNTIQYSWNLCLLQRELCNPIKVHAAKYPRQSTCERSTTGQKQTSPGGLHSTN